jgi:hypothetical protein
VNQEERERFFKEFNDKDIAYLESCIKRYFSQYNEGLGATKKRNDLIISTATQIGQMRGVLKKWKQEHQKANKKIIITEVWGGCDIAFEELKVAKEIQLSEIINPF